VNERSHSIASSLENWAMEANKNLTVRKMGGGSDRFSRASNIFLSPS